MGTYQKKYEVIKNTTRNIGLLDTGKRKLRLGKNGALLLRDAGEAAAIKARYGGRKGGDVIVTEAPNFPVEAGHRYTFGQLPAMPWHRFDKDGNRIRGKTK